MTGENISFAQDYKDNAYRIEALSGNLRSDPKQLAEPNGASFGTLKIVTSGLQELHY